MSEFVMHFSEDAFRLYILARIMENADLPQSEAEARFQTLSVWELTCFLGEYLTGEHNAQQWNL